MSGDGEGTLVANGSGAHPPPGSAPSARQAISNNGTNGAHKPSMNGSSHLDGAARSHLAPPTYLGHDREEVTRLLIQALSGMGYQNIAKSLCEDSGYELENPTVAAFRSAIMGGAWSEAENLLSSAVFAGGQDSDEHGLVLSPGSDRTTMRLWIRQQKFLELLEKRETTPALTVLRNEITPLHCDTARVHFLSALLMCHSPEDLKEKADWDGAGGNSRQTLLSELSKCISPSVMLPDNRLADLLQQVKQSQIDICLYHTSAASPSLYSDHHCDRANFPSEVAVTLTDLDGEIWQIQFSHSGNRLAACGSKSEVVVWHVPDFGVATVLRHDEAEVGNLSWSPDDSLLVTCSRDNCARIWETETWTLVKHIDRVDDPVTGCVWAPDGQTFTLSTLDKHRSLRTFNRKGDIVHTWERKHRLQDLCGSRDGRWLVGIDDHRKIHVYNGITRELEYEMELHAMPTSVSISSDSKHLLVNKNDGEAQYINLATRKLVHKFLGHTGGECLIRATFGGANESFAVSGSEDGNVWVWHKETGAAVERLAGHQPRCNSVAWNPADPCMLASCGDDGKVKIWSNKTRGQELRSMYRQWRQQNSYNGWQNQDEA
ncbi:related to WD40 repeat-containing protein [Cephalotrichum gorgonifer]|uniref:Related to WD40 repeat-containing protein n=1 Tax=Cephalotrichum gorgonifer TaxID=2041049 RepID=A0AAE8SRK0_9PEZI|nr:related to WD40 repeat-containing protein [Cephalotrichum gorgonifer]